ncbi:hypothetical protein IQ266_15950 [filamentous cyanobacterium LEGE 11480]|uniref:Uncharacterized protein n=1 Tax=Romeriopsis navalis LEGE 11480 TaxID=2777977 RepID=A0A928VMA7_9CYAN|nr:hypothetical protein [Romeriopsis navalis]MBE9031228.1 hypothetical protein [Romeriopsis navalis LEGE 11480]
MRFLVLSIVSLVALASMSPAALASKPRRSLRIACVRVGNRLQCRRKAAPTLRLCPTDKRQLCVLPKGDQLQVKGWEVRANASGQITWQAPIRRASHYQVKIFGHGVTVEQIVDVAKLDVSGLLQPRNAYQVEITAYQGGKVITQTQQVVNLPE